MHAAPRRASHARFLTRQDAKAFNQPLSFGTSSVTTMHQMFKVRTARALPPPALSQAIPVHAACTAVAPRPISPRIAYALLPTRQGANTLSAANKLLIRCAWAGTAAFAYAGYDSSWAPGNCA